MPSSHVVLDQVDIAFDDQRAVAGAGLLLPATLAERLGVEQVTGQEVDFGDRPGAARPGRSTTGSTSPTRRAGSPRSPRPPTEVTG
jgi:hypothetical protein